MMIPAYSIITFWFSPFSSFLFLILLQISFYDVLLTEKKKNWKWVWCMLKWRIIEGLQIQVVRQKYTFYLADSTLVNLSLNFLYGDIEIFSIFFRSSSPEFFLTLCLMKISSIFQFAGLIFSFHSDKIYKSIRSHMLKTPAFYLNYLSNIKIFEILR